MAAEHPKHWRLKKNLPPETPPTPEERAVLNSTLAAGAADLKAILASEVLPEGVISTLQEKSTLDDIPRVGLLSLDILGDYETTAVQAKVEVKPTRWQLIKQLITCKDPNDPYGE